MPEAAPRAQRVAPHAGGGRAGPPEITDDGPWAASATPVDEDMKGSWQTWEGWGLDPGANDFDILGRRPVREKKRRFTFFDLVHIKWVLIIGSVSFTILLFVEFLANLQPCLENLPVSRLSLVLTGTPTWHTHAWSMKRKNESSIASTETKTLAK